MVKHLLTKWAKGKESAVETVDAAVAHLRTNPTCTNDLLCALANTNPHNAHRDIVRAMQRLRPYEQPPAYYAHIPLWNSELGESRPVKIPFALPHEWLNTWGHRASGRFRGDGT